MTASPAKEGVGNLQYIDKDSELKLNLFLSLLLYFNFYSIPLIHRIIQLFKPRACKYIQSYIYLILNIN